MHTSSAGLGGNDEGLPHLYVYKVELVLTSRGTGDLISDPCSRGLRSRGKSGVDYIIPKVPGKLKLHARLLGRGGH